MIKSFRLFLSSIILGSCLVCLGCIDRGHPLFRKWSESESTRTTKNTEDRIANSPELQALDAICRDLPYFRDTSPVRKGTGRQYEVLFYYYSMDADFEKVTTDAKNYLTRKGWVNTKNEQEIWEYQMEFEKENYRIQISYTEFSDDNYATSCWDKNIYPN